MVAGLSPIQVMKSTHLLPSCPLQGQGLAYALAVLERVACQLDDESDTKAMLRMLVPFVHPPHHTRPPWHAFPRVSLPDNWLVDQLRRLASCSCRCYTRRRTQH